MSQEKIKLCDRCDTPHYCEQSDRCRVAQPAEQSWEHHARKLTQWLHCMSYNDSYFGEPAGLVKQVTHELYRLIDTVQVQPKAEPVACNPELYALARRCLWAAFAWNDHNFEASAAEYCRREAKALGINNFEEANAWLEMQMAARP